MIVSGTAVTGSTNPKSVIAKLREVVQNAIEKY